jgi:hypothetical protein
MSGKFLLSYICNFHVLSNLLLIYICKLHWIITDLSEIVLSCLGKLRFSSLDRSNCSLYFRVDGRGLKHLQWMSPHSAAASRAQLIPPSEDKHSGLREELLDSVLASLQVNYF